VESRVTAGTTDCRWVGSCRFWSIITLVNYHKHVKILGQELTGVGRGTGGTLFSRWVGTAAGVTFSDSRRPATFANVNEYADKL